MSSQNKRRTSKIHSRGGTYVSDDDEGMELEARSPAALWGACDGMGETRRSSSHRTG